MKYMEEKERILKEACNVLKCTEKDILKKIVAQSTEIKGKRKRNSRT